MFDFSWTELLVIMVVALIAIGPKELPRVLYELGKWLRRARQMAGEFQRHFSDMMHEAELDDLRRQAQAARDMTQPRSLAELVDPGGVIRNSFDPTTTGAAGYGGTAAEAGAGDVPLAEMALAEMAVSEIMASEVAPALPAPESEATSPVVEGSSSDTQG